MNVAPYAMLKLVDAALGKVRTVSIRRRLL